MHVSFPDSGKIEFFKHIVNTDDFGAVNSRDIICRLNITELIRVRRFIWKLMVTPWKEATLSGLKVPFLVSSYYVVKRLVCWRRICNYLRNESSS